MHVTPIASDLQVVIESTLTTLCAGMKCWGLWVLLPLFFLWLPFLQQNNRSCLLILNVFS